MKSVRVHNRFNLQELLEFFRPHSIKVREGDENAGETGDIGSRSNVVTLRLGNLVKQLSEPPTLLSRERTVRHIKQGLHADIETLAAMHKGEDVIVGGLLHSQACEARPPFLVRKHGLHSTAGRFHYEVWACVESAPTDPILLLELCASLQALGENIGTVPRLLKIAVVNGSVFDFDTRALLLMYEKIQELFFETQRPAAPAQLAGTNNVASFRRGRSTCGGF